MRMINLSECTELLNGVVLSHGLNQPSIKYTGLYVFHCSCTLCFVTQQYARALYSQCLLSQWNKSFQPLVLSRKILDTQLINK